MTEKRKKRKRIADPDSALCEQFRIGVSQVYGKCVWNTLMKKAMKKKWSGHELARQAGIHQTAVTKGRSTGELSFPYLVTTMVALELNRKDLPLLPAPTVLAIGGYVYALEHVRIKELKLRPLAKLVSEDVECMRLSWQLPDYYLAREAERRRLAEQIVNQVGGRARRNSELAGGPFEYLTRLRSEWKDVWARTIDVIKGLVGWTNEACS